MLEIHLIGFIIGTHFIELLTIKIGMMRRSDITFFGHLHDLFESLNQNGTNVLRTSSTWLIIIVIYLLFFIGLSMVIGVSRFWLIHVQELKVVIFIIELDLFGGLIIQQVCILRVVRLTIIELQFTLSTWKVIHFLLLGWATIFLKIDSSCRAVCDRLAIIR